MLNLFVGILIFYVVLIVLFRDVFKISRSASFAEESWRDDTIFAKYAAKTLIRNKNHGSMKRILLDPSLGNRRFEFLPDFIKNDCGARRLNRIEKTGLNVSVKDKLIVLIELHRTGEERALVEESIQKFLLKTDLQKLSRYFAENQQECAYLSEIKGKQVSKLKSKSLKLRSENAIQSRKWNLDVLERSLFRENLRYEFHPVLKGYCNNAGVNKLLSFDDSINKLTYSDAKIELFMELLAIRSVEFPSCRPAFVKMLTNLINSLYQRPAVRSVASCLESINKYALKYLEHEMLVAVRDSLCKSDMIRLSHIEQKFNVELSSLRVSITV